MKKSILGILITLALSYLAIGQTSYSDYETVHLDKFIGFGGAYFEVLPNPNSTGINTSANVGHAITGIETWSGMFSQNIGGKIDFSTDTLFTMKVYSEYTGYVNFKVELSSNYNIYAESIVPYTDAGNWQELTFTFPKNSELVYDNIVLFFDYNIADEGEDWYFDDIIGSNFVRGTGEKVTFNVFDFTGISSEIIRVYDADSIASDYNLFDDGTNGDDTADDDVWTAVATNLTGGAFDDSDSIGEYTWQLIDGDGITALSNLEHFFLPAGSNIIQQVYYYGSTLNNDLAIVSSTNTAPIIDGAMDTLWDTIDSIPLTKGILGSIDNPSDLGAIAKITFDRNNLYFLFQIKDQTMKIGEYQPYNNDHIALYFDMNNDDVYTDGEGQKFWIWTEENTDSPGTSAQLDVPGGWVLEIAVPFAELSPDFILTEGTTIGFDMFSGDSDDEPREAIISWHAEENNAYWNAAILGDLQFTNVDVLPSNIASLNELSVDGVPIGGFDSLIADYAYELAAGTTIVPTVTATATDAGANVVITPASELPGTTIIDVTAEDGVSTQRYSVLFEEFNGTEYVNFEELKLPFTGWYGSTTEIVANPVIDMVNGSDSVLKFVKGAPAEESPGMWSPSIGGSFDFSGLKIIKMNVLSDTAGPVLLRLFDTNDSNNKVEATADYTTPGAWAELSYDFSMPDTMTGAIDASYGKLDIIPDLGNSGTSGHVWWIDDIRGPNFILGDSIEVTVLMIDRDNTTTSVSAVFSSDKDTTFNLSNDGTGQWNSTQMILGDTYLSRFTYTLNVDGTAVPEHTNIDLWVAAGSPPHTISHAFGAYTYTDYANFENLSLHFTGWSETTADVVPNPNPDAVNGSDSVLKIIKGTPAYTWPGVFSDTLGGSIDLYYAKEFNIKVYSDTAGTFLLKLDNPASTDNVIEQRVEYTTPGQWADLNFDFSNPSLLNGSPMRNNGRITLVPDLGDAGTEGHIWYVDAITGPPFIPGDDVEILFEVKDLNNETTAVEVEVSNDPGVMIPLSNDGSGYWTTTQTVPGNTHFSSTTFTFFVDGVAVAGYTEKDIGSMAGTTVPKTISYEFSGNNTSATISGGGSVCNDGTSTETILIDLTGNSPWTISYSDGSSDFTVTNISVSPYTIETATEGTYTLNSVSNALITGTTSGSATISLLDLPTGTISGTASACEGESVSIPISLTGISPWTVEYSNGSNTFSENNITDAASNLEIAVSGNFVLSEVKDANGCIAADVSGAGVVNINPLPISPSIASSGNSEICSGDSLILSVAEDNQLTYQWKTDDGDVGTDSSSYAAKTEGNYTVEVSTEFGCSASSINTISLTVNPQPVLPTITITGETTFCPGESASLSVTNDPLLTYQWIDDQTLVDGAVSSTFIAEESGDFKLRATNSSNCSVETEAVLITKQALPEIDAGEDLVVCSGEAIILTGIGAGTINWDKGVIDGTAFIPSSDNEYHASIIDANGCTNSDTVLVTLGILPIIDAGEDQEICKGDGVTLLATGTGGFVWDDGIVNATEFFPAETKEYRVSVETLEGCSNADTVNVVVLTSFESIEEKTICEGVNLNWHDQVLSSAGTYTDTNTGLNGCDSTYQLILTVSPNPAAFSISGEDSPTTASIESYTAPVNTEVSYEWVVNNGSINQNDPNHIAIIRWDELGPGAVYAVASNENGCLSETSILNVVVVPPAGTVNTIGKNISIYPNPVKDKLFIDLPDNRQKWTVRMLDITGKVISLNKFYQSKRVEMDTRLLSPGIYFIKISANGETTSFKVVKY